VKLSGQQWSSIALLVLAVGSFVLVLVTRNFVGPMEASDRSRNLITNIYWREDGVRSITVQSGGKDFRLERFEGDKAKRDLREGDWTLYAPDREPADNAAVDRLLSGLGFAPRIRVVEGDPETFGLTKPEARLDIEAVKAGVSLALGKPAPSPAGAHYVSVGGKLAVVSKEVVALFRMTPDDFRERAFVSVGRNDVRELVLEQTSGTIRLLRSGPGFRIDGKERANRDILEPLFGALARLDAKRFLRIAEAEKSRGAPPALVIRITPSDEKARPVVLELGGGCPGFADEVLAIERSPRARAGCVERAVFGALGLERELVFDRRPLAARADEVETLKIERGSRRLVLTRKGSGFLLREPTEAGVALEAGNERLAAIAGAPAELVKNPDPKKLGLEPPEGRVVVTRLSDDDKAVEETLQLGRTEPDGTLYVRRSDDGTVLALGRDAARAFAIDATLLKGLKVLDFALSSLAELELSAPERQVLRRAEGGFTLVEPAGFDHDGALATEAVLALGSLTALRFVSDADDGTFGFGKPSLSAFARYDADGGAHSSRLVVGRSTPGGFFAKLDGDPSVFVIERTVAERLATLLIDRSAFMADPKTLARVSVSANGVTRTLERQHDELVPAATSGIDPAVAARLVEAIDALRPEAAVHTGAPRPNEGFARPALEVRLEPLPGRGKVRSFSIGASGSASASVPGSAWQAAHFARSKDVQATFLIADANLKPLFDLF
jgi:hypothetical protein